jgi:hypothetical protein
VGSLRISLPATSSTGGLLRATSLRIAAYSAWLKTASLPKLFIDAEPGVFITGRIRRLASSFSNQPSITANSSRNSVSATLSA